MSAGAKAAFRAEARRRIAALSPAQRRAAGRRMARRLWALPQLRGARVLLLYAHLPAEAPTDDIAEEARRRGVTLVYPRCLPATRAMALHRVARASELVGGAYGIREPDPGCPHVALEQIDVAVVPGLAWDRGGARLGRGAGYYDRLFARPEWRAWRCGLFFAVQELPGLPTDPWDAPLDAVVTEREAVLIDRA